MTYLITVIFISMSVSAMCSILEACLLSISHTDIAEMSSKKPKLAVIWNNFKGNIQKPIAVILIINTVAHTTGASLSGAQFDALFGTRWIVLFSFLFSFFMIQWTEILPKTMGVKYRKQIASAGAIPMVFLIKFFTPVIKLIELLNRPFMGKAGESGGDDAINEISVLSRFAFINNLISKDQELIISRTVGLTRKKVKDIMIPRQEIKFLNDGMTMMEALIEAHIHNHTRYPLLSSAGADDIAGYINFKDIVSALQINPENPSLTGIARPITSFYEDDSFSNLFKRLTHNHQHIAVVKNKNNELTGLVTLEDVIEEVIGEIEDEYDILPSHFYPIANNRYIAGGGLTMGRLGERLDTHFTEPNLSINDWIKKKYGPEQKSGGRHVYEGTAFIIKKISRSNISEVIIEK